MYDLQPFFILRINLKNLLIIIFSFNIECVTYLGPSNKSKQAQNSPSGETLNNIQNIKSNNTEYISRVEFAKYYVEMNQKLEKLTLEILELKTKLSKN